jgi:GNAT superfamily N-acetyltransferase
VAVDDDGGIHGFVRPLVEELGPEDGSRMYAPDRSVVWADVAADSPAAVAALAAEIRAAPPGAEADNLLWPTVDRRAEPWWTAAGFTCSAGYAVRPPEPLAGPPPPGVTARAATPADADAVVALHREAVAFQAAHSPYVRVVEAGIAGFRDRLLAGTPSVVLEAGRGLVGVCEWWHVDGAAHPLFQLPPGRYAYLNSVAVTADARGEGLGRALVAATLAAAGDGLDGSTLWFNPANPVASKVWPHLGWRSVWSVWDRRESVSAPS